MSLKLPIRHSLNTVGSITSVKINVQDYNYIGPVQHPTHPIFVATLLPISRQLISTQTFIY